MCPSKDSAYKVVRLGQIPGCFAVGRLYRVNWTAFLERSGLAGGQQAVEEVGGVRDATFYRVGVRPQGGRSIGMPQPPGRGADVPGRPDRSTDAVLAQVGMDGHRPADTVESVGDGVLTDSVTHSG
jgi:hypothetical protein